VGAAWPGHEASGRYGVGAPRNSSVEIVDRLNKEINAGKAENQRGAPARVIRKLASQPDHV
jgi:hypothetical protein